MAATKKPSFNFAAIYEELNSYNADSDVTITANGKEISEVRVVATTTFTSDDQYVTITLELS